VTSWLSYLGLLFTNYKFRPSFFPPKVPRLRTPRAVPTPPYTSMPCFFIYKSFEPNKWMEIFVHFALWQKFACRILFRLYALQECRRSCISPPAGLLCNKQGRNADRSEVLAVFSRCQVCKQLRILRILVPKYLQNK